MTAKTISRIFPRISSEQGRVREFVPILENVEGVRDSRREGAACHEGLKREYTSSELGRSRCFRRLYILLNDRVNDLLDSSRLNGISDNHTREFSRTGLLLLIQRQDGSYLGLQIPRTGQPCLDVPDFSPVLETHEFDRSQQVHLREVVTPNESPCLRANDEGRVSLASSSRTGSTLDERALVCPRKLSCFRKQPVDLYKIPV